MTEIPHAAVIFDVDGPLLNLTGPEEDAFFAPFETLHGLTGLSNDWDSYKVRNDEEIAAEILENHFGRPPSANEMHALFSRYEETLEQGFASGMLRVEPIPGAFELLERLQRHAGVALGTATANLRAAARIRLEKADMWQPLRHFAGAADGGGAKREVLARVIAELGLSNDRVVFLGDNLNDLDAGVANDVHFIGFHMAEARRRRLGDAGARVLCGDHAETYSLICEMLDLEPLEQQS